MKYSVEEALNHLEPLIKEERLIIFAGAGISVPSPSDLPTWDGVLKLFIDFCRELKDNFVPADHIVELLDEAECATKTVPTQIASVLRREIDKLQKIKPYSNISAQFKNEFQKIFQQGQPNEYHRLIVRTNYPFILTTNYDNLLEDAAKDEGYKHLWQSWYTFRQAEQVAAAIYLDEASIIHLHGHVSDIALDDFVFTAEDYVRISKKYPGFTLAIQALFMRYSVLFVGYGGTDPHLEDFMKELAAAFGWPRYPEFPLHYFIALPKNEVGHVTEKFNESLRKEIIVLDEYSEVTVLLERLQAMAPRSK